VSRRLAASTVVGLGILALGLTCVGFRQTLVGVWAANSLFMLAVAIGTAVRTAYIWQRPERTERPRSSATELPRTRFSIILPARHEPVLAETLHTLLDSDYPMELLQVVVVISDDDPDTELLAREVASGNSNVTVLVVSGSVRSKPVSLEAARPHCTGEVVGVLDAESLVAPGLLRHVDALVAGNPRVGVFQGGVQLMNHRAPRDRAPRSRGLGARLGRMDRASSWWRAHNCLEYYLWFASRLHFQAGAGFIPLGGNTVFLRTAVLRQLGGWDPNCLTEDCDLGVRACAAGVDTVVFYRPELATREETPDSITALVRQRCRWHLGFLQVLAKGDWLQIRGLRRRFLALETLAMPLFQAYCGIMLPVSLALSFTLQAPVGLVMCSWLPLGAMVGTALLEQAGYREFASVYQLQLTGWDSARLVLSTPFYQLLLSFAAVRAVLRLARRQTAWEKTAHSGAHLGIDLGIDLAVEPRLALGEA
jgi:cellulose synthase/poly-beta-1,6-N-acetylglucosamine synthase-like glycosyltransferase